jgi:hypothetical protein
VLTHVEGSSRNRPTSLCVFVSQVCNALEHLPYCIKFMQGLRDRDIFRFCAIPQIMSIGTLAALYNNGKVFEGEQGTTGQAGQGLWCRTVCCAVLCWAWDTRGEAWAAAVENRHAGMTPPCSLLLHTPTRNLTRHLST